MLTLAQAGAGQQQRTTGPVVRAYLTSLAEEFNELDFQLRHNEISRGDYERAHQRLTILRRFVERRAAESHEDRVPEFEVLTVEEFDMLGLSVKPTDDALSVGAVLDQRWKLIGIERGNLRFFVFEKLTTSATANNAQLPDKKPRAIPNPLDAIETAIVYQAVPKTAPTPAPTPQPTPTPVVAMPAPPRDDPPPVKPPASENSGPRILSFYLPIYTPEARKRAIEGNVIVSALFQREGKIKDVRLELGLGYGLDERAIEAVKKTLFEPARRDGQPIDLRMQIVFMFKQGRVTVQTRAEKR